MAGDRPGPHAADERLGDGAAGAVVEATALDGRGRLLLRISSSLPTHARGVRLPRIP